MKKRRKLLSVTRDDCKWDYFRASGSGGQKKNKTSSAVRCTHKDSGAVGQASDSRKQFENKKLAFKRMAETKKFKTWMKIEFSRAVGKEHEIEKAVEREMNPRNIKAEIKNDGKWETIALKDIK